MFDDRLTANFTLEYIGERLENRQITSDAVMARTLGLTSH